MDETNNNEPIVNEAADNQPIVNETTDNGPIVNEVADNQPIVNEAVDNGPMVNGTMDNEQSANGPLDNNNPNEQTISELVKGIAEKQSGINKITIQIGHAKAKLAVKTRVDSVKQSIETQAQKVDANIEKVLQDYKKSRTDNLDILQRYEKDLNEVNTVYSELINDAIKEKIALESEEHNLMLEQDRNNQELQKKSQEYFLSETTIRNSLNECLNNGRYDEAKEQIDALQQLSQNNSLTPLELKDTELKARREEIRKLIEVQKSKITELENEQIQYIESLDDDANKALAELPKVSVFQKLFASLFGRFSRNKQFMKECIEPIDAQIAQLEQSLPSLRQNISTKRSNLANDNRGAREKANTIINEKIQNRQENINQQVADKISQLSKLKDDISNAGQTPLDKPDASSAKEENKEVATTIKDGVVRAATAVKDGTVKAATTVKDGTVRAATAVKDGTVWAATTVKDRVVNAATNVRDAVVEKKDQAVDFIRETKRKIKNKVHIFTSKVKYTTTTKLKEIYEKKSAKLDEKTAQLNELTAKLNNEQVVNPETIVEDINKNVDVSKDVIDIEELAKQVMEEESQIAREEALKNKQPSNAPAEPEQNPSQPETSTPDMSTNNATVDNMVQFNPAYEFANNPDLVTPEQAPAMPQEQPLTPDTGNAPVAPATEEPNTPAGNEPSEHEI